MYKRTRSRCALYLYNNNSNMYIIVREVTNYTNEQLLLLRSLQRRVAPPVQMFSLTPSPSDCTRWNRGRFPSRAFNSKSTRRVISPHYIVQSWHLNAHSWTTHQTKVLTLKVRWRLFYNTRSTTIPRSSDSRTRGEVSTAGITHSWSYINMVLLCEHLSR